MNDKMLLEFNEDKTKAYITIFPSVNVTPEEIILSLQNEGILDIDDDIIRLAIKDKQFNRSILIASGIPPTKGEDAYFLYQFGSDTIEAIPGQILGVKVPRGYGVPGTTVTGETIIPKMGEDIKIILGKNTAFSQDKLKIYAIGFGNVTWTGNKVEVERVFEINNDVDESDIDFPGNVIIHGDVQDGFKIKADGNIHVDKNVGKAILESVTGDVFIGKQILPEAQIKAAKNIIANAIKKATLEAGGNVIVNEELIDSHVSAQQILNKGLICGGMITAHSLIEAKVIGNEDKTPTILIVDADGKVSASSSIYPETKITIGNITINIKRKVKGVLYHKIGTAITQSNYQPIRIKEEEITETGEFQVFSSDIPQSVIVKANSLSEAKEIGGELLNLSPTEVDCQMGIAKENPSLIRVFQMGVKGPWEEGWRKKIKEEISRMKMDNIDGMFEFFNTDTGLYLSVFPPKGAGKEIILQDILNYIQDRKFDNVNKALIKKAIENPSPKPILVGARQKLLDLDGKIEVEVAPVHS